MTSQIRARQRIQRDLIELERSKMSSISAVALDKNIFEWHVNIKPLTGVYSTVYFHLIMKFPATYPTEPPTIKICTPINHPNIFNHFLCLSMLRPNTKNTPYEGWSSSYSITSILMQLQSFLFADKIDQDGGYQVSARLSTSDVSRSIAICQRFTCNDCGHSHNKPFPEVIGSAINPDSFAMCAMSHFVDVSGTSCQTTHTQWVSAYGSHSVPDHDVKIYYEVNVNWTGSEWNRNNISGGLCRFGFGTQNTNIVGTDGESFGYGGTGKLSYRNSFVDFGESFSKNDTICCGLDLKQKRIYFAKNGRILEPNRVLCIDDKLWNDHLYPMVSFKNSRAEFNFGAPHKPCQYLLDRGFKTFEEVYFPQTKSNNNHNEEEDQKRCDWHSEYIIDEIWISIFEALEYEEIFQCKFVCKQFNNLINNFNVLERNQVHCYFTKQRLNRFVDNTNVLGVGLSIDWLSVNSNQVVIKSQMDYLSLNAWNSGCRIGVWGEPLTHFLPLVLNRRHGDIARDHIIRYLTDIASFISSKKSNNMCCDARLILIDTVITMMNQLVVQFVMNHKDENNASAVEMMLCEKVVLGYAQFHHLLLYLVHYVNKKHNGFVTTYCNQMVCNFLNQTMNGSHKKSVPDLGKFLIYCMISKYKWCDIAKVFIYEVNARNVYWIIRQNSNLNNTNARIVDRMERSLKATLVSRRLVMFQAWFMIHNKMCSLKEYNHRLGKPSKQLQIDIKIKTKHIMASNSWSHYMQQLNVYVENNDFNRLLVFAVYMSRHNGYHRCNNARYHITPVTPPNLYYFGAASASSNDNNNNNNVGNDNSDTHQTHRRDTSRSHHRHHRSSHSTSSRSRSRSRNRSYWY
eukprot:318411_1